MFSCLKILQDKVVFRLHSQFGTVYKGSSTGSQKHSQQDSYHNSNARWSHVHSNCLSSVDVKSLKFARVVNNL